MLARMKSRAQAFLEFYAKSGRMYKSAKAARVSPQSILNWRKNEPEFDAACKEAEQRYCELIDKTIHNRAIDGCRLRKQGKTA